MLCGREQELHFVHAAGGGVESNLAFAGRTDARRRPVSKDSHLIRVACEFLLPELAEERPVLGLIDTGAS